MPGGVPGVGGGGRGGMSATNRHKPPPPQVSLLDVGGRAPGRHPDDFYATPTWVTDGILAHLPTAGAIVEPSCGDGAILGRLCAMLPRNGGGIHGIELDPERARQARMRCPSVDVNEADYLEWAKRPAVEDIGLIIGNPPFVYALEFVEASIALAAPTRGTVAMLLRLAFLESQERASFHKAHPADLYPLASRPSFTPDGKTDSAAYAWLVWGPGRGGRWFAPIVNAAGRTSRGDE